MRGLRRNGGRHGRRPPAAFHAEAARGAPLPIWSLLMFVRDHVSEEDWKVLDEAIAVGAIDPVTACWPPETPIPCEPCVPGA